MFDVEMFREYRRAVDAAEGVRIASDLHEVFEEGVRTGEVPASVLEDFCKAALEIMALAGCSVVFFTVPTERVTRHFCFGTAGNAFCITSLFSRTFPNVATTISEQTPKVRKPASANDLRAAQSAENTQKQP